jgi:hypothetical protein
MIICSGLSRGTSRTLLLRMHILHVYAIYALHFSGSKMGFAKTSSTKKEHFCGIKKHAGGPCGRQNTRKMINLVEEAVQDQVICEVLSNNRTRQDFSADE